MLQKISTDREIGEQNQKRPIFDLYLIECVIAHISIWTEVKYISLPARLAMMCLLWSISGKWSQYYESALNNNTWSVFILVRSSLLFPWLIRKHNKSLCTQWTDIVFDIIDGFEFHRILSCRYNVRYMTADGWYSLYTEANRYAMIWYERSVNDDNLTICSLHICSNLFSAINHMFIL